ncbi:MAG: radical SAM protein [bacterium]|nr:radical SAM protein [bacterium]
MNQPASRLKEVEQLAARYPSLPKEAILKQDMLRLGVGFSEDSLRIAAGFKPKDYFIFSFDLATLEELEAAGEHLLRAPEEVRFFGGSWGLAPTIFNVRLAPKSPYQVGLENGKLTISCGGEIFAEAEYHPVPPFYSEALPSGKSINETAPVLEWGYLIYLTVYRLCQYWGKDEECQFCDINENYRQQKKAGREYTGIKNPQDILDALDAINRLDTQKTTQAITLTGGSITGQLSGQDELAFYLSYAKAIYERFGERWILKAVVEAFEKEACQRLYDEGGVRIYHPNYEVWDPDLFKQLCPGKERFVGYNRWMRRILESAEVFGPERVIPNFVGGVEMAQPYGFTDPIQAVESTVGGLEYFMSRGIMPRFTTWCPEPLSFIGNQPAPPLEYFVHLLYRFRETVDKYGLKAPPGYGKPGVGHAVFSVSAFMDVLKAED